ncbi:MAG: hemolysin family protein [Alphaproteobacteria bacterium]
MNENVPPRPPRDDGAEPPPSFRKTVRNWLRSLTRSRNGDASLRESFEELIEQRADEAVPVDAEEREMLLNLLRFGALRVDDVMVPRTDIVAVEQSTPLAEVAQVIREAGHSRIPVFRGSLDDIIGMVHVRDLLRFWGEKEPFALNRIVRRVLFVPPSMPVRDLLLQMRVTRIHMAMVVDEYGGTDGLLTIEDLVEEIVGEIHDEHDADELPALVERPDGMLDADARVPIDELEARVGVDLLPEEQEEHIDTLGGLVFSLVGRIPARGEIIDHVSGLQFEVVDADPRRVKRLRIHHVPRAAAPE